MQIDIPAKAAKPPRKTPLSGAIDIAIKDAERFGTKLVVQGKDGQLTELSPAAMKQRLKRRK